MAVNLSPPSVQQLHPIDGIRIGVAEAGIRKPGRKDLTVLLLDAGTLVSGVFTQNRFCAAPVKICQAHLGSGLSPRAILINTGNANAGTGPQGAQRAMTTCQALAQLLQIKAEQVLPLSTGVIMEPLPHQRIIDALPTAIAAARPDNWALAAQGIMTTDTVPKAISTQAKLQGRVVTVTGIAKGAGMIRPNMATMLGIIATDAAIDSHLMPDLAFELAESSFNRITVDGDTSTNDSFLLIATGRSGMTPIKNWNQPDAQALKQTLKNSALQLAQAIVRDGEGASKFITVQVEGGANSAECRQVAYAIAHSPLVKTAFYACDPNLGRILAAIGYAGITDLDPNLIDLFLDEVHVAQQGARHPDYLEQDGQRVMQKAEICVRVLLGRGHASETVWTCDLSHEYVSINADYRS